MFATLELAKKYLDITINDYDDMIQFYIDSATTLIKNYVGRNLEFRRVAYATVGNDKDTLKTITYPLKNIYEVLINDIDVTSECSIDVDSKLFIYRESGFPKKSTYSSFDLMSPSATFLKRSIKLDIDGGYILPNEEGSDFPKDIQNVCIELVKHYFTNSSIESSISQEGYTTPNYSFSKSYALDVSSGRDVLNDSQKEVLNRYKEMI